MKENVIIKFTYLWVNNELLHGALSPTSGVVGNPTTLKNLTQWRATRTKEGNQSSHQAMQALEERIHKQRDEGSS